MAQTAPKDESATLTREDALARIYRLRAEIAAENPDMTDEDWDALAERWAAEVKAGLAKRVRKSREASD